MYVSSWRNGEGLLPRQSFCFSLPSPLAGETHSNLIPSCLINILSSLNGNWWFTFKEPLSKYRPVISETAFWNSLEVGNFQFIPEIFQIGWDLSKNKPINGKVLVKFLLLCGWHYTWCYKAYKKRKVLCGNKYLTYIWQKFKLFENRQLEGFYCCFYS